MASNIPSVAFPGPENPTFRGKLTQPAVANGRPDKYLALGWHARPWRA